MLSSHNRLLSSDISPILRTGMRVRGEFFDLIYQNRQPLLHVVTESRTPLAGPRFAIIVSSKVDKRATKRNRMKRLVREAVRKLLPSIREEIGGVFVVRRRLPDTADAVLSLVQKLAAQGHVLKGTSA